MACVNLRLVAFADFVFSVFGSAMGLIMHILITHPHWAGTLI